MFPTGYATNTVLLTRAAIFITEVYATMMTSARKLVSG